MRKVLYMTAVLVVCGFFGYLLLCFQPVMPEGKVLKLSTFQSGSYSFQVWQRKREYWLEPFTTAVFVRHQTNAVWDAYTLGIQDIYKPPIRFQTNESSVKLSDGGKLIVNFDIRTGLMTYANSMRHPSEGTTLTPSNWWTTPLPTVDVK